MSRQFAGVGALVHAGATENSCGSKRMKLTRPAHALGEPGSSGSDATSRKQVSLSPSSTMMSSVVERLASPLP
jgi:hypothetical protein